MNEDTKETVMYVLKKLLFGTVKVAWFVVKAIVHYIFFAIQYLAYSMMP